MNELLLGILATVIILALPAFMAWSAVDHVRNGRKRERRGGSGSAGVGAALQELDRLVARPSVEHTVEAERRVLRREDDAGDKK
jgi:hypothetical protein